MGQLWATSVPGDSRRAWTLAITEGEYPPGGTAVRLAHIDAESKIGRSVGRRQHPAERQRSRILVFWWQGSGGVGEGDFLAGEAF